MYYVFLSRGKLMSLTSCHRWHRDEGQLYLRQPLPFLRSNLLVRSDRRGTSLSFYSVCCWSHYIDIIRHALEYFTDTTVIGIMVEGNMAQERGGVYPWPSRESASMISARELSDLFRIIAYLHDRIYRIPMYWIRVFFHGRRWDRQAS